MTSRQEEERINAGRPLLHAASIKHYPETPVQCVALDPGRAGLLACATRDKLSVWALEQPQVYAFARLVACCAS